MKISSNIAISTHIVLFFLVQLAASSCSPLTPFLQCLTNNSSPSYPTFQGGIYTQQNSSFLDTLLFYARNRLSNFSSSSTLKPEAIITATNASDVQATIICSKATELLLKIRSGGHNFDGLSYASDVPYIILDMFNLRSVDIDRENDTAWVESGATVGDLYYKIAKTNNLRGFPAGVCPTMGAGGHFSGGGYGNMMRKYGLSVDNIIDAQIVDVNGRILDRKAMGEDLFWAIRGGGGASFGVVLSWKLKLVPVPAKVTVFAVERTLEQGGTDIAFKWQKIATKLPNELFIRLVMDVVNGNKAGEKTIRVTNVGLFLGNSESLLSIINTSFPELGLNKNDTIEMSWLQSVLFWDGIPIEKSPEVLLERKDPHTISAKIKSDIVYEPIPIADLETIWKKLIETEIISLKWNPYGGRMSEIADSETPFSHRNALFKIQHYAAWDGDNLKEKNLKLMRDFYDFLAPYVSKSPREAYLNYGDVDIGSSRYSNATFEEAKVYGEKYFTTNFDRLVKVKTKVDPSNFFRNEQSIPTLLYP